MQGRHYVARVQRTPRDSSSAVCISLTAVQLYLKMMQNERNEEHYILHLVVKHSSKW